MKTWIHIDFWFWDCTFRADPYLTDKEQKHFEVLLAKFISKCRPYILRKFYLYEDTPHCFLALELKGSLSIPIIDKYRSVFTAPFIYKTHLLKNQDEPKKNEGFLDILNAFTEFYLFKKDNRITHIIHCCMEFMMQSRQKECEFYQNMAILYQVKKINGRKIAYGYKKINWFLRRRLLKYIDKLDLSK